jgi:hypothetical protein
MPSYILHPWAEIIINHPTISCMNKLNIDCSINLETNKNTRGISKNYKFYNVSNINGSLNSDLLIGDKFDNQLYGLDGDDIFELSLGMLNTLIIIRK